MTPTAVSATALHTGRATNATPACCSIVLREQLVAPEEVSSLSLCPRASILLFPVAQQNFHQNNYVLAEISASESPGGSEMLLPSIWPIILFDGAGAMSQNQKRQISPALFYSGRGVKLFSFRWRGTFTIRRSSIAHARSCTPAGQATINLS